MKLVSNTPTITLQLGRDLRRAIKRGHAWVYHHALVNTPKAVAGSPALLLDAGGEHKLGFGFYDPTGPIALRICSTQPGQQLNDAWADERMQDALDLRRTLFGADTTGYRLFNGEGDGLPGLICDRYAEAAVLQLDGQAAAAFYQLPGITSWLVEHTQVRHVFLKGDAHSGQQSRVIQGDLSSAPIPFVENGLHFTADPLQGQKTGFFLDQRDNRALVGSISEGKSVLNLFGYTGAFSVYAGAGRARQVTTVDSSQPALTVAEKHWDMNGLPAASHQTIAADAFDYLQQAARSDARWDVVILDPPSFAASQAALPAAIRSYTNLIAAAARITAPGGILAAASCSSHVDQNMFLDICQQAISQARRMAITLGVYGQPPDHPAPLVMSELRYLKFILLKLD